MNTLISKILNWILGPSWKTTVWGYSSAAAITLGAYLTSVMAGTPFGWEYVGIAIAIGVLGRLSKHEDPTP
jgi:hypothetical protein